MFRRLKDKAIKARRNKALGATGRFLAVLLVVAGGLDVASTGVALAAGQVEGNPIIVTAQEHLGIWWAAPKILFHLALAMLILWLPSDRMISVARVVIIGYSIILLNNLYLAGALI